MTPADTDRVFGGSIPQRYEQLLVPLIFQPYARDLALQALERAPAAVLEVAAGTGVVTRQLARVLPDEVAIVATDLNRPMLDHAAAIGTARPVRWEAADAMRLPYPDHAFDVVVCQFGVMFFPDKPAAFGEAHRVLRPGGALLFSVWDRIEANDFAHCVTEALAELFPSDPPRFLARTPHGYHAKDAIVRDLAQGGFDRAPRIDTVTRRSRADTPWRPAAAYCQGTPLRNEIEARDPQALERATAHAAAAVAAAFGDGPVDGAVRAHVVAVAR